MAAVVLADNSYGTLSAAVSSTDSSISLTAGHGARFPLVISTGTAAAPLYACLINSGNVLEEIKITGHVAASDSMTVVRGVGATTAKAWNAGDRIEARLSSSVLAAISRINVYLTDPAFGGIPDGVTDISAAWAAAIAYVNLQVSAAIGSGFPISLATLHVPSGDYVVTTGATVANCNLEIVGDGRENTRIQIGVGQYLITATANVYNFLFRGIQTSGGKGTFKHTNTAANVLGNYIVEDNYFFDYTECAIGSLSSDMPYWNIRRNRFYGSSGLASKGIALAGDNSGSGIEENEFHRNKYHIKLARCGIASKIKNNDFIRFTNGGGAPALTDIWLVPSTGTADAGLVIADNKYGNENRNAADYVVLIAEEAAGSDFVTKDHSTSVSANYATNVTMRDNDIAGTGIPSNGIVYSYTPNVGGWLIDNVYRGSQFPYVVHFDAGVTVDAERSSESNLIRGGRGYLQNEPSPRLNYSNAPSIGILDDPLVQYAGFDSTRAQYPTGFDPGYTDLWTTASSGARLLNQSATTRTNIADSINSTDAAEYTFSSAIGFCYGYMAAPAANRQGWIYFEVKRSTTHPIAKLQIDVRYDADAKIPVRRIVNLSTNWQPVCIPWTPREASAIQSLQFRVAQAADFSAGVTDRFQIGRIRVYQAASQMQFAGRFDGLQLKDGVAAPGALTGVAQIYVDASDGDLKIIFSDGTIKTIVVDT